jgi:hypothetical protein
VRLWFEEVDSGRWMRHVATGPTQSGKTLSCWAIPLCYYLFERGETVIPAVPDLHNFAADKWRNDLLPVIERTRYRDLIPKSGKGSKGGAFTSVRFGNGSELRFMGGKGGDKSRAGYTSRVLVVTETDGFDVASMTSREADPITQLEGRTMAYGSQKRVFMECTVSTAEGRTWTEYEASSRARIVLCCPLCSAWVIPEREHLRGWQEARTEKEARRKGHFVCPACERRWTEDDREAANQAAVLAHRGQEVEEDGTVSGELPDTDTLGFRWTAANNLFQTAGDMGAAEWRAAHAEDEDNAERELRQFWWATPVESLFEDLTSLDGDAVAQRQGELERGVAPDDTACVTVGLDVHKREIYWQTIAWGVEGGRVLDYGRVETPWRQKGEEDAIRAGLTEVAEHLEAGYRTPDGSTIGVNVVMADCSWGQHTALVVKYCKEMNAAAPGSPAPETRWMPVKGYGASQDRREMGNWRQPKRGTRGISHMGDHLYVARDQHLRASVAHADADYWKSWYQKRLAQPADEPGAITLYRVADVREHGEFKRQVTAEEEVQEFKPGKGYIRRWERIRRQNHYGDCGWMASAAKGLARPAAKRPAAKETAEKEPQQRPARRPRSRGGWQIGR